MVSDKQPLYMVIDVESIGLHGEGFAVGYVIASPGMEAMAGAMYACHPDRANGGPEGREWVANNLPKTVEFKSSSPRAVRERFWEDWLFWKERGAVLVADCAWPVEARFLAACVDDNPQDRTWEGPYPLHELASFMVAAGMDPMAPYDRLPDEPQHDPLGDAKQSARLLLTALWVLDAQRSTEQPA